MSDGISDGFGDLTPAEIVENYRRWAHKVANVKRAPFDPIHDDLVQEALLAIWEVLQRKGTDIAATYLAAAGSHRMNDVLDGRPMRGSPSEGGKTYRPKTVSSDGLAETAPDLWEQLLSVDALAEVELAYHHGEILSALSDLKPQYRAYVVMRFWGGLRDVDIADRMGTTNKIVGTWWSRAIAPVLRERLSHMADAL